MKKTFEISGVLFILLLMLMVVAGCAFADSPVDSSGAESIAGPAVITADEDKAVKDLLREYFTVLFDVPSLEEYSVNTGNGIMPEKIHKFIAASTLEEGNGNPEIGLHLPRFVSINGMTVTGYEPVKLSETAEDADVTSGFVAKNGDSLLYFSKVRVRAKVIPDEYFDEYYRLQSDNTYIKTREVPDSLFDTIKAEIRYDVTLAGSGKELAILRATEADVKPGLKNRLFRMNNESITLIPYLDLTRSMDGNGYRNVGDGETYEAEKSVIACFFNNLCLLDRERMNLLSYKWEQGLSEVKDYWDYLGITVSSEGGSQVIELTGDYRKNIPYDSLPLRYDMERLNEIRSLDVTPHPAYSEKQKLYNVTFGAPVQKTKGITDEYFIYRYDYLVSDTGDGPVITGIKLNECYQAPD